MAAPGRGADDDVSVLVERLRDGDEAAREEVIRAAQGRLERLARKMLRRFPGVRRWEETGDVLQNALLRLIRALKVVTPGSSREFFGLAAEQIRRELLDLARHYQGAHGLGRNHASWAEGTGPVADRPDQPGADDLDRWAAFHAAVEKLPPEEREVVTLTFYHGWTQAQIGRLLGMDERTVRRRWVAACAALSDMIGELPAG